MSGTEAKLPVNCIPQPSTDAPVDSDIPLDEDMELMMLQDANPEHEYFGEDIDIDFGIDG